MTVSEDLKIPIVFEFQSGEAADAVLAGANTRLAKVAKDAAGWLLGISAGQAGAAIKAEAKGLCYAFTAVHPYLTDAPIVGSFKLSFARRAAVVAFYAFIISAGALVGLVVGIVLKGP